MSAHRRWQRCMFWRTGGRGLASPTRRSGAPDAPWSRWRWRARTGRYAGDRVSIAGICRWSGAPLVLKRG